MILLMIIGLVITTKLSSLLGMYKYLLMMLSGIGTVMIARWYWWRVNPYSEIAAIVACLIIGNVVAIKLPSTDEADLYSIRLLITTISVAVVWIAVTLLTSKEPGKQTIAFYSKMKISGPGWKKVRELAGIEARPGEFKENFIAWLSCIVLIFSLLLGTGKFIFHQWIGGLFYLGLAIVSGYVLKELIGKMKFD